MHAVDAVRQGARWWASAWAGTNPETIEHRNTQQNIQCACCVSKRAASWRHRPLFRERPLSAAGDLRPAMYVPSSHLVISVPAIVPSVCLHRTVQGSQHQSNTAANETDQCNNPGGLTCYGVCDAAEEQHARAVVGPRRWQHHRQASVDESAVAVEAEMDRSVR